MADETGDSVPAGCGGLGIKAIRKTGRESEAGRVRGDVSDMSFAVNHSRRLARSVALYREARHGGGSQKIDVKNNFSLADNRIRGSADGRTRWVSFAPRWRARMIGIALYRVCSCGFVECQ